MKKNLNILLLMLAMSNNVLSQSVSNDSTFYELKDAVKAPTKVKKLLLRSKKFNAVPKEIFTFTNLEYLDFHNNNIKDIPNDIENLTHLKGLILSHNIIKKITVKLSNLKNLEFVSLQSNKLKHVPKEISSLRNLKILNISDNHISRLPLTLNPKIHTIIADFNSINLIDEDFFSVYEFIEHLTLRSNQVKLIPEEINQAFNLITLNLNNNKISNVPEELFYLKKLEEVRLGKNLISQLPEINKKSNIKIVDLSENLVTKKGMELFKKNSNIPTIFFSKKLNRYEYERQ